MARFWKISQEKSSSFAGVAVVLQLEAAGRYTSFSALYQACPSLARTCLLTTHNTQVDDTDVPKPLELDDSEVSTKLSRNNLICQGCHRC